VRTEPRRTCIGCRRVWAKQRLIRLVRLPDGRASVDSSGRGGGRGAYVCPTRGCLEAALKRGRLAQALHGPAAVEDEILALLRIRTGEAAPESREIETSAVKG